MTRWGAVSLFALMQAFMAAEGAEQPHVGYTYPAGGARGTAFSMEIGGQHLEGATNVVVTGDGVSIEITGHEIKYEPREIRRLFRAKENAEAALAGKEGKELEKTRRQIDHLTAQLQKAKVPDGVDPLDKKSILKSYPYNSKEQFNPQIAERLTVNVVIAPHAPPGVRELRIVTSAGISNPMYFQVGVLEELLEAEPNDDHMSPDLQVVSVPGMINGQIAPGDIDHFRFRAGKGAFIVVDVDARRIIPYLADAVPGWFQAVAALYDEDGNEIAYQDDYRFNPDPALFFKVPAAGNYTLSIRDSIYRGREDFVYRIAVGELPFITGIFPLGARQGEEADIAINGLNLPKRTMKGLIPADGPEVRHISVRKDDYRSNFMPFAVGDEPELLETEPNDAADSAQPVDRPVVINGRIQEVGDRDLFSFSGNKGDVISIEVTARSLYSPLDSVLTLTGPGLDEAIRNDDNIDKGGSHLYLGAGLVTHHADSYILHELPATGTYFVEIGDTQSKGGPEYSYRLRITDARPDFKLFMEPSGLHIGPGGSAAFTVRVMREEGFKGAVTLEAAELPDGFSMSTAVIPEGAVVTRFTITAPRQIQTKVLHPRIVGTGSVQGREVTRDVAPVDDQMQAFLYRHLVPARELILAPANEKSQLSFEAVIPRSGIIEVSLGSEAQIRVKGRMAFRGKGAALKLDDPPEGLSSEKGWIGRVDPIGGNNAAGRIFIKAEEPLKPGDLISLVVAAEVRQGRETTRYIAPAISVRIVE